jgi:hypothetical protein
MREPRVIVDIWSGIFEPTKSRGSSSCRLSSLRALDLDDGTHGLAAANERRLVSIPPRRLAARGEDSSPREAAAGPNAASSPPEGDATSHKTGTEGLKGDVERGNTECGKGMKKHVALAFYGLSRSLSYTIDSIHENILGPLDKAGYTYDVFLHTYNLRQFNNHRSHESGVLNDTEWTLLEPDFHLVESQVRSYCGGLQAVVC